MHLARPMVKLRKTFVLLCAILHKLGAVRLPCTTAKSPDHHQTTLLNPTLYIIAVTKKKVTLGLYFLPGSIHKSWDQRIYTCVTHRPCPFPPLKQPIFWSEWQCQTGSHNQGGHWAQGMRRARAAILGCSCGVFFEPCNLFSSSWYHALGTAGRESTAGMLEGGREPAVGPATRQRCAPLLSLSGLFPTLQHCGKFWRHLFWSKG